MSNTTLLDMEPFVSKVRTDFVKLLVEKEVIKFENVKEAFLKVPRHMFVETYYRPENESWLEEQVDPLNPTPRQLEYIYSNKSLVTYLHNDMPTSSSSQPTLVASMIQLLDLRGGEKILEIGAGTGYNAALMAEIVGSKGLVIALDLQEKVITQTRRLMKQAGYGNVILAVRDGSQGFEEQGPYDRIVATVGCDDISPNWVKQLSANGIMLLPMSHGYAHPLIKITFDESGIVGQFVGEAGFMPMLGESSEKQLWPFIHMNDVDLAGSSTYPSFLVPTDIHDFLGFLLLREQRAFWIRQPRAYGIYENSTNFIILEYQTGTVHRKGNPKLYDQVSLLYQEWIALGKPLNSDYTIHFVPLAEESLITDNPVHMIKRKHYVELLHL